MAYDQDGNYYDEDERFFAQYNKKREERRKEEDSTNYNSPTNFRNMGGDDFN